MVRLREVQSELRNAPGSNCHFSAFSRSTFSFSPKAVTDGVDPTYESVWGGVRIVGLLVALGGGGEARGQLGGSEQGQADHGRELLISATQADSV